MAKVDMQIEGNEELIFLKERAQKLIERIEDRCAVQDELVYALDNLLPNLASTLDLSLKVISAFKGEDQNKRARPCKRHHGGSGSHSRDSSSAIALFTVGGPSHSDDRNGFSRVDLVSGSDEADIRSRLLRLDDKIDGEKGGDSFREGGNEGNALHPRALNIVKVLVAAILLERTPFVPLDSAAILRKLENGYCTPAEKNILIELGGEFGAIAAVEKALKAFAGENTGVESEDFAVSGRNRIMILGVDQNRLAKEFPEAPQLLSTKSVDITNSMSVVPATGTSGGMDLGRVQPGMSPGIPRPDMWPGSGEPHPQGVPGMPVAGPPMFPGGNPMSMMGPRGGPRPMGMMGLPGPAGMPAQGMGFSGLPPIQKPPMVQSPGLVPPTSSKQRTEEDDMKDIEALLKKKSFREMQKSKTGEELYDLIHRPTARETALAAKFKSKGGTQLKEYCKALTKEDCRRQRCSIIACEKVHFRRIIALHTDISLGDCSFLDTCRHMKTCKYVHYELDPTPDAGIMMGITSIQPQKPLRAEYCSEVELGEPQWINCDIRNFRMDILGQFGVIMADPPWDIHMELPYGTMADDEMRNLNVPSLQTDGLIFLWVTGRAMELGRDCLELWGYRRVEEIIWVKTNQLQRIIRTGRTGHWLNHSKEHCLVGIKGNPEVNRNIDTDVIVSEVRETSRKPDEMYPMLERISPRTRKLELFARMHNTHAGWMSLGNQLNGARLVDEGLRARFKATYPDVEVQPLSPPRATVSDGEASAQTKSRFTDAKVAPEDMPMASVENYASEEKLVAKDIEMTT